VRLGADPLWPAQLITAPAPLLPSLAFPSAQNRVRVRIAIYLKTNQELVNECLQVVIDMVGMQQLVLSIMQNGLQHTQAAYATAGGVIGPGATPSSSNYIAGLLLSATEQHVQEVSTSRNPRILAESPVERALSSPLTCRVVTLNSCRSRRDQAEHAGSRFFRFAMIMQIMQPYISSCNNQANYAVLHT
jgi:hypothetical protein